MRILVALDFSESSSLACRWALSFAKGLGAEELLFFYVGERGEKATEVQEVEQAIRDLRHFVATRGVELPEDGIELRYAAGRGTPAEEILRAIGEHGADIVVTGTSSRKGLDRLLLGSVAEAVVRKAPCTAIVVKPGMST